MLQNGPSGSPVPLKVIEPTADIGNVTVPGTSLSVRERSLRALEKLPPFSPILNRLIASLAHEDVSFAKIADLIEKDTVLAGSILRLVNSALYGLPGTVNSIRHAVSMLGINKLRNAALSMSVGRMWNQMKTPPSWSMARFNLHSVGVGILADLLAQRLNVPYAEGAFAAGLFHDLGVLLVATGLPEEYLQIAKLCQQDHTAIGDYELQVLGTTHAELSAEALATWNLPEPIQIAVRYHVNPELDPSPIKPGQTTLSRVLAAADQHVKGMGTFVSVFEAQGEESAPALQSLGLGERLPTIMSEFDNEFAAIQPYF